VKPNLTDLLCQIEKREPKPILVLGDLILDRYLWGTVSRISPEAPVPVLEFSHETYCLGGAANVASNLAALGAQVELVGVTGDDREREMFLELCQQAGISTRGLLVDQSRPTTSKTRVISHNQQIVRIDREEKTPISAAQQSRVLDHLEEIHVTLGSIVISDYAKGMLTESVLDGMRQIAAKRRLPVVVDPKNPQFSVYRNFTIMTPNSTEAALGAGFKIKDELTLVEAGRKLRTSLNMEAVLITRGAHGMSLFEKGKEVLHLPTVARNVYDVTGAGDTVTAVMALGLAAGLTFSRAAHLANHAAGFVIGKFGTATVTVDDLRALDDQT
jgi:rfaE bifunctional protein kinase chain/domain